MDVWVYGSGGVSSEVRDQRSVDVEELGNWGILVFRNAGIWGF